MASCPAANTGKIDLAKGYIMNLDIFVLCRYATEHGGSLTIVDTINFIEAHRLPWKDDFYIVAKFNPGPNNNMGGDLFIKIFSLSDDGERKEIFKNKMSFECKEEQAIINIIAEFQGFIFKNAGSHLLALYLDDELLGECRFNVLNMEEK